MIVDPALLCFLIVSLVACSSVAFDSKGPVIAGDHSVPANPVSRPCLHFEVFFSHVITSDATISSVPDIRKSPQCLYK
jgi:hypothetical protein